MKRQIKIKVNLNDAQIQEIRDAAGGRKVKSIKVKIEASHSGFVNKNDFFYTPKGMSDGIHTFVEPYQKPVQLNHDDHESPVGRVLESKYVDYTDLSGGIIDNIKSTEDPARLVDDVKKFIKTTTYAADDFKGLGHAELIAEITDEEAIEKILDKRYLTVSIGGKVDQAICSACGVDKMFDSEAACDHYRGEDVNGETVFYIGGLMEFNEVSYVNSPADSNAVSEVISDSEKDSELIEQTLEILDYEIDTGDHPQMKIKLKDLLSKKSVLTDALTELGLSSCALSDEEYGKLRKTSFLFANERVLPLNDKAHILAAYKAIEDLDDQKSLDEAKVVLDRKFAKAFGEDTSYEDALKEFKTSLEDKSNPDAAAQAKKDAETSDINVEDLVKTLTDKLIPLISDAVTDKLQKVLTVSDSFSAARAEALEVELESLENENKTLTDLYKQVIIKQILIAEDKVSDEDYKAKLESRHLDSLVDKLTDLGFGLEVADEDTSSKDNDDKGKLADDVSIDDASDGTVQDDKTSGKANVQDDKDKVETLDVQVIQDEYKKLYREKGTVAANAYLKDLREKKQIPNNFTF